MRHPRDRASRRRTRPGGGTDGGDRIAHCITGATVLMQSTVQTCAQSVSRARPAGRPPGCACAGFRPPGRPGPRTGSARSGWVCGSGSRSRRAPCPLRWLISMSRRGISAESASWKRVNRAISRSMTALSRPPPLCRSSFNRSSLRSTAIRSLRTNSASMAWISRSGSTLPDGWGTFSNRRRAPRG